MAMMLIVIFGFVAFCVDYGHMAIVKAELQNAADASALAAATELAEATPEIEQAAKDVAAANRVGIGPLTLNNSDITPGVFDVQTKTFTPAGGKGQGEVH